MATRNDVARLANVSPSVVSYVVNNSNYVSAEKRKAVLEAIEKLDYVPNQNAKNLRTGRTKMIAVVRGSQFNDLFNDLLYYIEGFAYEKGYHTSLMTVIRGNDGYSTSQYVDSLISRQYDAIFVANSSMTEAQLNELAHSRSKILLYVTRDYVNLDPSIGTIIPNYRKGTMELVDHMIDLGHERIALIPNLYYPNSFLNTTNHRFAGYLDAFKKHNLPLRMDYLPENFKDLHEVGAFIRDMYTTRTAAETPTAIVADSVFTVNYIVRKLKELHLSTPEDVSVVALTNSTLASLSNPSLTGIGFDAQEVGHTTVDMIIEMIKGGTVPSKVVDLKLYERESLAPPRKD